MERVFLPCAARSQWSPPGLARHVSSCDVPKALAHQQLLPASRAPGVGEEDLHSCRAGEYGAVELGLILCGDGGMETHMDHKWGCRVQHTVELWVRQWERTFAILPKVGHSGSLCLTGHSHHLEDRPAARTVTGRPTEISQVIEGNESGYLAVGAVHSVVQPADRSSPLRRTKVWWFTGAMSFNAPLPRRTKHQVTRPPSEPGVLLGEIRPTVS